MKRMTRQSALYGNYIPDGEGQEPVLLTRCPKGLCGPVADRLAAFETMVAALHAEQTALSKELEALRAAGKKNTSQFRDRLGKKLLGSQLLSLLGQHGIR